jgi:hypothetical protein
MHCSKQQLARAFASAADQFTRIAGDGAPSAYFLVRVRQLVVEPPGADGEPVTVQEEK